MYYGVNRPGIRSFVKHHRGVHALFPPVWNVCEFFFKERKELITSFLGFYSKFQKMVAAIMEIPKKYSANTSGHRNSLLPSPGRKQKHQVSFQQ